MNQRSPTAEGYITYKCRLQLRDEDWKHLEVWARQLHQSGHELIEEIIQQWIVLHHYYPDEPPPIYDPEDA